jgi:hypothetical protein
MKRWMLIFGILDLCTVATYLLRVPAELLGLVRGHWLLNATCLLMMASLVISGAALLRGQRWGFYFNYVQFPVRLFLAFLSFAWLALLILPAHPSIMLNEAIWGTVVALEGVRLGITIMLHAGRESREQDRLRRWIVAA